MAKQHTQLGVVRVWWHQQELCPQDGSWEMDGADGHLTSPVCFHGDGRT